MVTLLAMTTLRANQTEALELYLSAVLPLVEKAGGKLIERYEVAETIVGESGPKFVSIITYPNEAALERVFQSKEYKAIEGVRESAFSSYSVHILS